MRIVDISPVIDSAAVVWPGDVEYSLAPNWSIVAGDTITVNTVTTTAHVGAHIDAPSHVIDGAPSVFETSLEACIGDCLVVDVSDLVDIASSPRGFAPAAAVKSRINALSTRTGPLERLLLRHSLGDAPQNTRWDPDIPGIDPALVEWFGSQGGLLMGIDLVSFDPANCASLTAHKAAIGHEVVLLEGLDLSKAPVGHAELLALPLPWRGADASPVRAVLRLTSSHSSS
ncbi:MAG: cyclase family protein [Leucobacter sp.]